MEADGRESGWMRDVMWKVNRKDANLLGRQMDQPGGSETAPASTLNCVVPLMSPAGLLSHAATATVNTTAGERPALLSIAANSPSAAAAA